jgi:SAM-dependent methyltransferase
MKYDRHFFGTQRGAVHSARKILPIAMDLVRPKCVVDVGCGIGAWAFVAKELSCEVVGLDGEWVPRDQLLIDADEFIAVDLTDPQPLARKFDLAICLEVAEHLPSSSSDLLVRFLSELAPVVMFSAAVPFQMGTGHINEQYPSYWADVFARHGLYPLDAIRPVCWSDDEVEFYYRQNVLLFARDAYIPELLARSKVCDGRAAPPPLDIVHPDAVPILAQGWVETIGTMKCFGLLMRSAKRSIERRLGWGSGSQ